MKAYSREWWGHMIAIHDAKSTLFTDMAYKKFNVHGVLIHHYAGGGDVDVYSPQTEEWHKCEKNGEPYFSIDSKYRETAKFRLINGVECPLPHRNYDKIPSCIYVVNLNDPRLWQRNCETHDDVLIAIKRGLVFDDKDAAITTAKAILKGLKP